MHMVHAGHRVKLPAIPSWRKGILTLIVFRVEFDSRNLEVAIFVAMLFCG